MSIFSRLKKPAPGEAKPEPGATPLAGGDPHPPASTAANGQAGGKASSPAGGKDSSKDGGKDGGKDGKESRPAEASPPAKANGVHTSAPKAAEAPAAPAPKANGVSNGKAAHVAPPAAAEPTPPAKKPDLSTTVLYGAAKPTRAAAERPNGTPPPPAPVATREPARSAFEMAIDTALGPEPPGGVAHGKSTDSDQAALRATFEDVAVPYVAEVRSVMMELQFGEVQASWFETTRPLLRQLRKMAEPVGQTALVTALDDFDKAVGEILAPGQPASPTAAARDALFAAYTPLRAALPRAFELEGERDRREPLIVRALLEQVPGLEPVMVDTLMAAGFSKLSALYAARADEIAAVTGISDIVSAAIATRVQNFRRTTPAGLASVDRGATLRELEHLAELLRAQHLAFDAVARGWTEQDKSAKRQARRERQLTQLQITIELVRLGEVDLAQRLEKLPFAKKLDEVERFVSQALLADRAKNRAAPQAAAGAALAT
jgi:hypothetical protein